MPFRRCRGFSFLELVLVVVIIGILAALAAPYLQQSRKAAQEKNAMATVRTLFQGEAMFRSLNSSYGTLDQLIVEKFVDDSLLGGKKSGYEFSIQNISTEHFEVVAVPLEVGVSGDKGYYTDETGVIRYSDDGSAPGPSSSPAP